MASIIGKKYAGKYTADNKDWLAKFVDDNVTEKVTKSREIKDEEGKVTGTEEYTLKKTVLNLDKLFTLADKNSIDTTDMRAQRERPNAAGRIRMTLGNQLRAAAKRRHGLFNVDGNFVDADAAFIGDNEKTENPDGSRIPKATAPAADTPATENTEQAA